MRKTVIALALVFSPLIAFAETTVSVNVPDHCTVVDTDGVSHTYAGYLGICALQAALDAGSISGAQFSNAFPSLGLFVTSVGGIAADPNSQYWALYQNGGFASVGLSQLSIAVHDSVTLELHDFSDNFLGSRFTLSIDSLASSGTSASSGGGSRPPPASFSVSAALAFLGSKQHADGSFGSVLITDWTAIALASANEESACPELCRGAREKARSYLLASIPVLANVTDYERHAMALMSLSINPYNGTPTDYIAPIVGEFDGTQIGSPSLVNDDIFALFPLPKAGFSATDEILQKIIAFIVAKQKPNGSWEESIDLTAAAVQALSPFASVSGVRNALTNAREYLHDAEDSTGGWKNSFSTSWALQAIHALQEPLSSWTKAEYSPLNFLGIVQLSDGGVEPTSTDDATRIWATAYAIPAARGKPWNSILQSFSRPENPVVRTTASNGDGVAANLAAPTAASTSQEEMLATPPAATSTQSIPDPAPQVFGTSAEIASATAMPEEPLEKGSFFGEEIGTSANRPATTSAAVSEQVAMAGQALATRKVNEWDTGWTWFSGLILILFGVYYYLRRA